MKTLILYSTLLLTSLSAHAASVSVTVDGQTYQCSPGSGGSCGCKTGPDGRYFHFIVTFGGEEIESGRSSWNTKVEAINACARRIKEIPACN